MQYRSYEDYMRDFLGYDNQMPTFNHRYPEERYMDKCDDNMQYEEIYNRVSELLGEGVERTAKKITDYIVNEVKAKTCPEDRMNIEEAEEKVCEEEVKEEVRQEEPVKEENVDIPHEKEEVKSQPIERDIRNIEQDVRKPGNMNNVRSVPYNPYMNRFRKF